MFIEVQEGVHNPNDNSLKNITLTIAYSGTYSVKVTLDEAQAKELMSELLANGISKFNRFKKGDTKPADVEVVSLTSSTPII